MEQVAAYSAFALTVSLVVTRPRIGSRYRIGPAVAGLVGVLLMVLIGVVGSADIAYALGLLWRPLLGIAAIMVTTHVADRVGVLTWLAGRIEHFARGQPRRLFAWVYALSAVTAAAMNNDAAVLILTPVVVDLVRRVFPGQRELLMPFAFAVFMAAGVAPLVVSNPMNMVVASFMHIGFNAYALAMLPVWLAGTAVSYGVLWLLFRGVLRAARSVPHDPKPRPLAPAARSMLLLLGGSLLAYPALSYSGAPVYLAAIGVAVLAVGLARHHGQRRAAQDALGGVSWNILLFLIAACIVSLGLRNVGLVERVRALYAGSSPAAIGMYSALGSALLNNHPMSHINMLALRAHPDAARATLAALVGGDLGPRMLPIGSLAGLLWLDRLQRSQVEVSLRAFLRIGLLTTAPALAACLLLLALT